MNDSRRFECFPDPLGQWTIWDNRLERPLCLSGSVMIGLSRSQARAICRLLNDFSHTRPESESFPSQDAIDLSKRR
jgi:hypothetical protein